jgi:glycosyltransferase involved in cell wall biosynthesis
MKNISKKIILFYRRPYKFGHYSIEKIFDQVFVSLKNEFDIHIYKQKFYSRGILKRILNCIYSSINQGLINHITGDIHYICIFFKKKKTILTIHDCTLIDNYNGIKKLIYYFFWFKIPYYKSEYITTISNYTKERLVAVAKFSPDRIIIIPDPISNDYLYSKKIFNSKCPTILQIGTTPNKNISRVAEALNGFDCNLRIIGKISEVDKKSLKNNSINFTELIHLSDEDVILEYKCCDIVSFLSTYEGFGLPILEAQATGRVVITSNICSMPEVSGDGALLVNPFSISDIRAGFELLSSNEILRDKLINSGLKNVEKFRLNNIIVMYRTLYRNVQNKLQN